jgi:hypothetical protein
MYLTFDNTKPSAQNYAEDAPAPANSIVGQSYNVKGWDKVRMKRQVRISERAGCLLFHPYYANFGMKVTFLTSHSRPQFASI